MADTDMYTVRLTGLSVEMSGFNHKTLIYKFTYDDLKKILLDLAY